MRLFVCLLLAISAHAAQSLTLDMATPGSGSWSGSPYTSVSTFRLQARIHGYGSSCPSNKIIASFAGGNYRLRYFTPGGNACMVQFYDSIAGQAEASVAVSLTGESDTLVRVQRIPDGKYWIMEATALDGSNYRANIWHKDALTSAQDASGALALGESGSYGKLAWVQACSNLADIESPILAATACTNWGHWQLEGDGNDTSGAGNNFTLTSPSWTTTTVADPGVVLTQTLGGMAVVGVGSPQTLDFCSSYTLSDSAISSWTFTQQSGTAMTAITGASTCSPAVTPPARGEYGLRMVISDGTNSTQYDFTLYAVPSTSTCLVTDVPADAAKILGPITRYGKGCGWEWEAATHKWYVDLIMDTWATDWDDPWNDPDDGTITVTNGSNTVTGDGTSFRALFCGGGSTPVNADAFIVVYHSTPDYGDTGRAAFRVDACVSDTEITIYGPYRSSATASGVSYSHVNNAMSAWLNWQYNDNPGNYYEAVLAVYALYYRTGNSTYLTFANEMADRWWRMPAINRYHDYIPQDTTGVKIFTECRNCAVASNMLYAAVNSDATRWIGISRLLDRQYAALNGSEWLRAGEREDGYSLMWFGYCASIAQGNPVSIATALDPDTALRDQCQAFLGTTNRTAMGLRRIDSGDYVGSFPFLYSRLGTHGASGSGLSSTVQFTNGSNAISCASGTCNLNSLGNPPQDVAGQAIIWAYEGSPLLSNSQGDADVYYFYPTSASAATLDRNYTGTTGAKNWSGGHFAGFGTIMYMSGLHAHGLYAAYQGLLGVDATNAAYYATWVQGVADYVYASRNGEGQLYARQYLPCEPLGYDFPEGTLAACGDPNGNQGFYRVDNASAIRTQADAWLITGNAQYRTQGDLFMNAAFAKPGYAVPSGFSVDYNYIRSIDISPAHGTNSTCDGEWTDCGASHREGALGRMKGLGITWGAFGVYGYYAATRTELPSTSTVIRGAIVRASTMQ